MILVHCPVKLIVGSLIYFWKVAHIIYTYVVLILSMLKVGHLLYIEKLSGMLKCKCFLLIGSAVLTSLEGSV